jgi:hypothetical protein
MQLNRTERNWFRCRNLKRRLNVEISKILWDAMRKRGEKATAVEKLRLGIKSASAKSLVNGRSQVRATIVTCLVDEAEMRHARKRAVGENQSRLIDERSRCWGKAAAPNEVIFLSSLSSSPSSIVKFHVTQIY